MSEDQPGKEPLGPVRIKRLEIRNFRSIDFLTIKDIPPFAVFAGPNGCGKSNLLSAFTFVNHIIQFDLDHAIRRFGGIENVLNRRLLNEGNHTFILKIIFIDEDGYSTIQLQIHLDPVDPFLVEDYQRPNQPPLHLDSRELKSREASRRSPRFVFPDADVFVPLKGSIILNLNILDLSGQTPELTPFPAFPDALTPSGNNIAQIVHNLKTKSEEYWEELNDWMESLFPGFRRLHVEKNPLDGKMYLMFEEKGHSVPLPGHLISSGTFNFIRLFTAILNTPAGRTGMTLIDEPETGLHPKALAELVQLMRDEASKSRPIWVATHNESVIRYAKPEELFLVDKTDQGTQVKAVGSGPVALPLDEAWLCNVFGAGLPW